MKFVDFGEFGELYNIGSGIVFLMKDILDIAILLLIRLDIMMLFDGVCEWFYDEKIFLLDNRKI